MTMDGTLTKQNLTQVDKLICGTVYFSTKVSIFVMNFLSNRDSQEVFESISTQF